MANPLILLEDIRKVYGTTLKNEVLKGVNLTIEIGEFCSIIGPSGSGKSTLLNVLGTLDTLTSGSYIFNGTPIEKLNQQELAKFRNKQIGFIFQFHHLLPEFTAIENILMPYWITGKAVNKSIQERANNFLELVGLSNRRNYKITNLSGGQQQRIAIARALMNEPMLVLADEPTGNLDSESTEQVYTLLRSINKRLGTTFIIVTHDRHLASKSDRIIEVIDGKVSKDIPTSENNQDFVWEEIRPCNCMLSHSDSNPIS